jgi:flagellar hook-associated protein 2
MISQLMQVEAAPQTRLKTKVSTAETAVASYQSVNSKLSAIKTAADNLSQLSTWRSIKATSSSETVKATAQGGVTGTAGITTFNVASVAKAQVTTAKVDPSADITSADSITLTIAGDSGNPHVIDLKGVKTAEGVAAAINDAGLGVKAAVVKTGGDANILQLTSTKTGTDFGFDVTGLDSLVTPLKNLVDPSNARLEIAGGENGGGYDAVSSSNTFTGLIAGVDVTVSKIENNVTVESTADVGAIADKYQAFVDAVNSALGEIGTQTAFNATTKKGSPLTGDFSVRQMTQQMLSKISMGLTYDKPGTGDAQADPVVAPDQVAFGSLAKMGIELDSSGALTFKRDKFTANYAANPTAAQEAGIAFGDQWESMAKTMSNTVQGVITGRKNEIDGLSQQISNWDVRLSARKVALQKQYAGLEVALGNLKNQSNWLAGQLGG